MEIFKDQNDTWGCFKIIPGEGKVGDRYMGVHYTSYPFISLKFSSLKNKLYKGSRKENILFK